MDYDDYDEEQYYEPTPADDIFLEAKQKLEDCLKESIKLSMKNLKEENKLLKEENENIRKKVRNIEQRESQIKRKEDNLEANALRKKFSEMLKPLETQSIIYNVDYGYEYIDKCDKCNENRELKFISPMGKNMTEYCKCNKKHVVYYPQSRKMTMLAIYKDRSYARSMSITPKYESTSYDDSYCKFELKTYIENLEDTSLNYDMKEFDYKEVGFKTEKDCQLYCDYLNTKIKTPKNLVERFKIRMDEKLSEQI